jgi:signal transduction histidine kinase
MKTSAARKGFRAFVVAGMVAICLFVTYRYHFLLGRDVVFSHIYYLPIALAGVWGGLAAIPVSLGLALYMLASRMLSDLGPPDSEDLLRSAMFVTVGLAIGLAAWQRDRLQAEAQREHEQNFRQLTENLAYTARVSHELRNPLQVILGVLDALPRAADAADRERLIQALERNAEGIRGRIQELTRDA